MIYLIGIALLGTAFLVWEYRRATPDTQREVLAMLRESVTVCAFLVVIAALFGLVVVGMS